MSYPPPRHSGPGRAAATFRPAGQEPELRFSSGGSASYLATQVSTDGDYGLFRWDMGQTPGGPAPHFHRAMSEAFYVLDGTVLLYDGDCWREAGPGDFLYVPAGGVHAFRNPDGPASMLMLFAPGAPRETYFETLASLDAEARAAMTEQDWAELFGQHDQFEVDGPRAPR
jgi:mannose-6-phosphate isomerase-like protein (cupin superfamily)